MSAVSLDQGPTTPRVIYEIANDTARRPWKKPANVNPPLRSEALGPRAEHPACVKIPSAWRLTHRGPSPR